jgi:hypothetical protein
MRSLLLAGLVALAAVLAAGFAVGALLTGFTHPANMARGVAASVTPLPDIPLPADLVPPSVGTPPVLPVGSAVAPAPAQPAQPAPPVQQPPVNAVQAATNPASGDQGQDGNAQAGRRHGHKGG